MNYEIHVTVKALSIEKFKRACKSLNVKPIVLALQKDNTDVMTSSKFVGDDESVFEELERITKGLERVGYTILRKKIESDPIHLNAKNMTKDQYFETHIEVTPSRVNSIIARMYNAHISSNLFKENTVMVTYRAYALDLDIFNRYADQLFRALDYTKGKRVTEFALYDSNVDHDKEWLND